MSLPGQQILKEPRGELLLACLVTGLWCRIASPSILESALYVHESSERLDSQLRRDLLRLDLRVRLRQVIRVT